MIGPGLPPDFTVLTSTVRAERLPDPGARFAFEVERPNAVYRGTLVCDGDGLPLNLTLAGPIPIQVSRVPPG